MSNIQPITIYILLFLVAFCVGLFVGNSRRFGHLLWNIREAWWPLRCEKCRRWTRKDRLVYSLPPTRNSDYLRVCHPCNMDIQLGDANK